MTRNETAETLFKTTSLGLVSGIVGGFLLCRKAVAAQRPLP